MSELTFVVQKHDARRLHYDVRFKVGDVLASWAVPKGPSYNPKDRRLAMKTEDHPLDYELFEGTIPKGEFGAGSVIVWDRGTYENITMHDGKPLDMAVAIERGHFAVIIVGEKLKGEWTFTRMARSDEPNAWMMIKKKDDTADATRDIVSEAPDSVLSGLSNATISGNNKTWTRGVATWTQPMLAHLAEHAQPGEWTYERKLDGLRCIAVKNDDTVELWSRNRLSFNARFPHIIEALRALPIPNFTFDGEIVAIDEHDRTSFGALQQGGATLIEFQVFDLLHLLGNSTLDLPIENRKELLRKALGDATSPLQFVENLDSNVTELMEHAYEFEWEGLIAKRVASTYQPGRSSNWIKLKCLASQELVIGGWTDPSGARVGFGALLVGYYDKGEFIYAGKVGTGFNTETLKSLSAKLHSLDHATSPFNNVVKEKGAHWVTPKLVANIAFGEWTSGGKLRHPRFEGLRTDKNAKDVVREKAPRH